MFPLHRSIILLVLFSLHTDLSVAARNNCLEGSFFNGSSCRLCPRGKYQDEKNSASCKPCPLGTFSEVRGIPGLDLCRPCPPGTFGFKTSAVSQKECKPCPKGKSSDAGTTNCVFCPPGHRITSTTSHPKKRRSICQKCGKGSISDVANALKCKQCVESIPMKGNTVCGSCPRGFGWNAAYLYDFDSNKCNKCSFGTYSDATFDCTPCRPGYQPNLLRGGFKCVPCPPGTFKGVDDLYSICKPCKKGENKNATGASFCVPPRTPCPSHYFLSDMGSCQTCTKGERFEKSKNRCFPCGRFEESKGGLSSKCTRCSRNKMRSPDGCVCRTGYETLPSGACFICPSGYLYDTISGSCIMCPPNCFSKPGALDCTPCPPNKIVTENGSGCEVCPTGTRFAPAYEFGSIQTGSDDPSAKCVDARTNCRLGEERVVKNDELFDFCQPRSCPSDSIEYINKVSHDKPRRSCVDCPPGSAFDLKDGNCNLCPPDSVSEGGRARKCKRCPKGLFRYPNFEFGTFLIFREVPKASRRVSRVIRMQSRKDGSKCDCVSSEERGSRGFVRGKCRRCPRGTYGYNRGSLCIPCPAGYYQNLEGSLGRDSCTRCAKGSFSDKRGSAVCKRCPKGTTSFGVGDTGCVKLRSLST